MNIAVADLDIHADAREHLCRDRHARRRIFREALEAGGLAGWFALAEQFHTQSDPAYCGLGTLVMVLNALAIDPGRAWKGPWPSSDANATRPSGRGWR